MVDKSLLSKPVVDESLSASQFLQKIGKEVKAKPSRWTQGTFARDRAGGPDYFNSPIAVCWCIEGFIAREPLSIQGLVNLRIALRAAIEPECHWKAIFAYNDILSNHKDFLAWLRRAWKEARKLEAKNG